MIRMAPMAPIVAVLGFGTFGLACSSFSEETKLPPTADASGDATAADGSSAGGDGGAVPDVAAPSACSNATSGKQCLAAGCATCTSAMNKYLGCVVPGEAFGKGTCRDCATQDGYCKAFSNETACQVYSTIGCTWTAGGSCDSDCTP